MSALLIVLIIADGLILAASYSRHGGAWAYDTCHYVTPVCDYPHALIIAAILMIVLLIMLRA